MTRSSAPRMGLVERVILLDASKAPDTPDTSEKIMGYQPKPAWIKACTPDTSDTSKNTNSREVFSELAVWRSLPPDHGRGRPDERMG